MTERDWLNMEPGMYPDMPFEEYLQDPCPEPSLNSSIARILIDHTPAHARVWHPRLGSAPPPEEYVEARVSGTAIHAMLLASPMDSIRVLDDVFDADPPPEDAEVVKVDGVPVTDFKTKRAREERDRIKAKGGVPVTEAQLREMNVAWTHRQPVTDYKTARAQEARDAAIADGKCPVLPGAFRELDFAAGVIRDRLRDRGIDLRKTQNEVTLIWEHKGVWYRCRLDAFDRAEGIIYDIKSSSTASPTRGPSLAPHSIQAALQIFGVETLCPELVGRVRYRWLRTELKPPFAVCQIQPSGGMLHLGAMKLERATARWKACLEDQHWPDYPDAVVAPKPWEMAEERETPYWEGRSDDANV